MTDIDSFLKQRHQKMVIDVRSESEFANGHVPGSINIPILNNEERTIVGITYKQQGSNQAVVEGIRLTGPRLHKLVEQVQQTVGEREALAYCWRGGMRSQNFCWIMQQAGVKVTALTGGYKQYRRWILHQFERKFNFILLTGFTGSGKTEILAWLNQRGEQTLCLESFAHHKGSAFGGINQNQQPTTEQFENNIGEALSALDENKSIWIEDEAIGIGNVFIPLPIWQNMRESKLIKIEVDKEERIERLLKEYGMAQPDALKEAIKKIEKKLGGQHAKAAMLAIDNQELAVAADIILTYYDKYYDKSIESRKLYAAVKWNWQDAATATQNLVNIK
jgi:tRNA 2-selenouridine synthase